MQGGDVSRCSDPLGLTHEQRVMSNVHAIMRGGKAWFPPERDPQTIDGQWTENTTINELAESLHRQGLEVQLALEPIR
jgi:hypothetical protein